ncbi:MAG: DUF2306 domain-containing protein [Parvularcula sp.]|jgi:uncharacterized membrane protein|nr:DUF2306 domain-containing protein [Parvularcula sp.]
MNWNVVTELTPPIIALHWGTAVLAFFLGLIILLRPKGTGAHRTLGLFYAAAMVITAVAAFFVREGDVSGWAYLSFAGMSPIHLFVPMTLFGIASGLLGALVWKNASAHRSAMISTYVGALLIAGLFTFLPGRRMHLLIFADPAEVEAIMKSMPPQGGADKRKAATD